MYRHFFKRVFDIFVSLWALGFILLLAIPIAIAIKLEDGGSVFYCGWRYGKDMKKFKMVKFRSMKMNSEDIRNEDGTTFNSASDPRMTRVGAFLRKTSLDELPQFFNVLVGDMSLIGPRPSPMGNEKTYDEFVMRKFRVRPGITGLNQALLRNSATLEERYQNDVKYAEELSFAMDVKIVWWTICSVLGKKNIYKE